MSDKILADTIGMQGKASNFASQAVQLADLIHQVSHDIQELAGLWGGDASTSFQDFMVTWNSDINNVQLALDDVAGKVKNAGLGYGDLDHQIATGFTTGH
jgi:WXG100 family type VII secretion target